MNTMSTEKVFNDPSKHTEFFRELESLKKEIKANIGIEDYKHLRKIELWGKLASLIGYLTAWIPFNFLSAVLISTGNFARWTMITHHVTHKGYDKIPNIPNRYYSTHYAKGWRRYIDWLDWLLPDAWDYEHNFQHHYRTGETADPDLVEHNLRALRESKIPVLIKYLVVFFFVLTWKFSYYTPSTLLELQRKRIKEEKRKNPDYPEEKELGKITQILDLLIPIHKYSVEVWVRCVFPYVAIRFGIIPLLFLPFGADAWFWVLIQSIAAELLTNVHSFVIIGPNHAGSDLYRFDDKYSGREEYYLRQIIGSTNYNTGNEFYNFLQGYLNYQIEHHLWPDLPMLKYKQYQPKVKELCNKYGIPYIQESFWIRLNKMVNIAVGKESMKRITSPNRSNVLQNIGGPVGSAGF